MFHAVRIIAFAFAFAGAALSLGAGACNGEDKAAGNGKTSGAKQSASVPKVQFNRVPCDWISRAEAEKVLGEPLISDPVRVRSAENAVPQADGDGCLYEMKQTSEFARRVVAIQMELDDAGAIQAGFSGVPRSTCRLSARENRRRSRTRMVPAAPTSQASIACSSSR